MCRTARVGQFSVSVSVVDSCSDPAVPVMVIVDTVGGGGEPPPEPPPDPPPDAPPPPHAETSDSPTEATSTASQKPIFRRGRHHSSNPARLSAPAGNQGCEAGRIAADALAAIVRVVVAFAPPLGVTVVGLKVQVTPAGNPEQAKLVVELKPFCGLSVTVTVPWLPGFTVRVVGDVASVKLGGTGMAVTSTVEF